MKLTIPSFENEFDAVGPIWPLLYEAEDFGCEMTRSYFDGLRLKMVDPYLGPEIQRFHARLKLRARGLDVEDFEPDEVSRNGIAFWYRGRHIKVWKRDSSIIPRLPRAGTSLARLHFLRQGVLPNFDRALLMCPNRVILYEVDKHFRLTRLWFAIPASAEEHGPTEVYWIEPITFEMACQFGQPADIVANDEVEDLPLTLREPDEVAQEADEEADEERSAQ